MAIPPPEILNSRNVNLVIRAAELGWVSQAAAKEVVEYTLEMARDGEYTDALEVLAKKENLSSNSVEKIFRDENAPKKWWQFWKRYPGPDGVWGAPVKDLLNAMYGKNRGGHIPAHSERAERELHRRVFDEPEKQPELLEFMFHFKRPNHIQITPDPINRCLDRWQKRGLKLPDNNQDSNIRDGYKG